jgi:transcriptional regulator with XRE-family HTH domain
MKETATPNRIAEWRKRRGLTMRDLAARADTTASQINKLEKGHTRLTADWMVRLSKVFNCAPGELILASVDQPASADLVKNATDDQLISLGRWLRALLAAERIVSGVDPKEEDVLNTEEVLKQMDRLAEYSRRALAAAATGEALNDGDREIIDLALRLQRVLDAPPGRGPGWEVPDYVLNAVVELIRQERKSVRTGVPQGSD